MSTVILSKTAAFLRCVAEHTSCLLAVLTLFNYNGWAADYPEITQRRDGTWLRDAINQYQRLNVHETLSGEESNNALAVRSYVCAIVDLERYLVLRANLLAGAVAQGRKKYRPNAERREGMATAIRIIVPLMQTKFSADGAPL